MSGSPVDEYLATLPDPQRAALARICDHVRAAVPGVEEATSYGIPAFKYRGKPLLGLRAARTHLSVFPFSPAAIEAAREELAGLDLAKGTVRFTLEQPLSDAALDRLLRQRLGEIEAG